MHDPTAPVDIAVISAGISEPSSTRLLADRIAQRALDDLRSDGIAASVTRIDLGPLALDITRSLLSGVPTDAVKEAIDRLARSHAVIASTPVYKAGVSGLFKSFVDLLDNDLLIARPVALAATGGTARHAMVVDDHMRPLFGFFRALPTPTSVYAAPEDWGSAELGSRISRAARELTLLIRSAAPRDIAESNWAAYQHQFGGSATKAARAASDVDFGSDLMRLAAGGR